MQEIQTKQQALNLFEDVHVSFLSECRKVAREIAERRGRVTIDDVRERVPRPFGLDGRVYGAVFNSKEWEHAGFTRTRRKESHSRPISIFRLKL